MKYLGIESASQEIRDAIGKCEVCGEQATAFVQDMFEIIPFSPHLPWDVQPAGMHLLCTAHEREAKIIQIKEGPAFG
jgi:hypothetical protein